ncbi:MAG: hypothetical protein EKK55_10375 [Rhodocyclaceae bacterium]|nr:MAG: hypothetical protein EKK55_10375 [Rhodocyclaceae bacterium]
MPLNFRVPASIKARLDAAAASENRAPSEVARTWLESWITCDHVVEEAMRHGACSRLEMEQALEVVARAAVAAGVDYDRRWVAMAVAGVTRQGGESSAAAAGLAAMVEQWPATPWGSLPVWRRGHPRPERFV